MLKYLLNITTNIVFLIFITLLFLSNVFSKDNIENYKEVESLMSRLETSIDNLNKTKILSFLSTNADSELEKGIKKALKNKTIDYFHSIESIKKLDKNRVKVIAEFRVEGRSGYKSWNLNSINYFVFEKINNKWKLLDTNFHKKLDLENTFEFISKIFKWFGVAVGTIVLSILLLVFWIWMLVDCIKRPLKNKTLWLLVIIFVPILGEFLYFFIPRRNYIKSQEK